MTPETEVTGEKTSHSVGVVGTTEMSTVPPAVEQRCYRVKLQLPTKDLWQRTDTQTIDKFYCGLTSSYLQK